MLHCLAYTRVSFLSVLFIWCNKSLVLITQEIKGKGNANSKVEVFDKQVNIHTLKSVSLFNITPPRWTIMYHVVKIISYKCYIQIIRYLIRISNENYQYFLFFVWAKFHRQLVHLHTKIYIFFFVCHIYKMLTQYIFTRKWTGFQ